MEQSSAPSVTIEEVNAAIAGETYTVLPNGRTTVCQLTLDNGFTVEGSSACVSLERYNQELGEKYARARAVEKVLAFLGFRLADRLMQDKQPAAEEALPQKRVNPVPSVGRVILYTLDAQDVEQINRRRTTGFDIAQRAADGRWPAGAQAHIGNLARVGDVLPGMVIQVWGPSVVNAKIELDGTDQLWKTSIDVADEPTPGRYHWMDYQKQQAAKQS